MSYRTDRDGKVKWIKCIEAIQNSTSKTYYTPYMIIAESYGCINQTEVIITKNKEITIRLNISILQYISDNDNDGFLDVWERFLGTNPRDQNNKPIDTDEDGLPDGDAINSEPWMDADDDNDGYSDAQDLFPKDSTPWEDRDGDGYGDNPNGNRPDLYPDDPTRWEKRNPLKWNVRYFVIGGIATLLGIGVAITIFIRKKRLKDKLPDIDSYDGK